MKLSDIRVGWQVVTRNGETSTVMCDGVDDKSRPFIKGAKLADYNDDLTSKIYPDLDIVEVYGWPRNIPKGGKIILYFKKYRSLMWKDESTFSSAETDVFVSLDNVKAVARVIDDMLTLCVACDGKEVCEKICENGSRDELITNGERIDYEVFRSLNIKNEDGILLTLTTAKGNAVYLKSKDSVTAEEERVVYKFKFTENKLIRL